MRTGITSKVLNHYYEFRPVLSQNKKQKPDRLAIKKNRMQKKFRTLHNPKKPIENCPLDFIWYCKYTIYSFTFSRILMLFRKI
jgi:hypothetical protein